MDELLNHILSAIAGSATAPTVEKQEDDFAITYTITADKEIYPTLVGKKGATIKALTTLVRSLDKKTSDSTKRIFLTAKE